MDFQDYIQEEKKWANKMAGIGSWESVTLEWLRYHLNLLSVGHIMTALPH